MFSETLKLLKRSWKIIVPYWKSEDKYKALAMLVAILILTLGEIGLTVKLSYWYQAFYDALEKHDYAQFIKQIKIFFLLIMIFIPTITCTFALVSMLQFRWRQWMTNRFLRDWTTDNAYYHAMLNKDKIDNPDQRISQDLDLFSSLSLDLFLSFFKEIITLFSFAFILWTVSSGIPLKIFGYTFKIHGYLVWAAFLYAMVGTVLVVKIGQPLIGLDFVQQRYEANFRYSLIRLQEKREEIAIFGGIKPEVKNLKDAFNFIRTNYYQIVVRNVYINFCYISFVNISQIIPLLAAAPMYFANIITLGIVMQVGSAFGNVRSSFSVIAKNFRTIASWKATVIRLLELDDYIKRAEGNMLHNKITFTESQRDLSVHHLTLQKPNHDLMLKNINFSIKEHDKTLLIGGSGVGKSTIIRALRGLWTSGEGKIELPANIFYVPQRPYMPIATLREAMIYPTLLSDYENGAQGLSALLELFKLGHLVSSLDEHQDWSTVLSLGEQQRISFIRILINKPTFIVMDEPSSSLNPALEKLVFKTLLERLTDVTIVTVGHSETLKKYHQKVIDVEQWVAS